jgi:hypothetical protein
MLQVIVAQLRAFPWSALIWLAAIVLVALIVWQFTKHHYAIAWSRYAPEKARDIIRQTRKELAEITQKFWQLEAENAELRGRIKGAQMRLAKPRQLELIEK